MVVIIVVCLILGFFVIVIIVLFLCIKYCFFWFLKEVILDCISDWKCCRIEEKNERKMYVFVVFLMV